MVLEFLKPMKVHMLYNMTLCDHENAIISAAFSVFLFYSTMKLRNTQY